MPTTGISSSTILCRLCHCQQCYVVDCCTLVADCINCRRPYRPQPYVFANIVAVPIAVSVTAGDGGPPSVRTARHSIMASSLSSASTILSSTTLPSTISSTILCRLFYRPLNCMVVVFIMSSTILQSTASIVADSIVLNYMVSPLPYRNDFRNRCRRRRWPYFRSDRAP